MGWIGKDWRRWTSTSVHKDIIYLDVCSVRGRSGRKKTSENFALSVSQILLLFFTSLSRSVFVFSLSIPVSPFDPEEAGDRMG